MILKHELMKILRMPIISILMIFFLVLNLFIIWSHGHLKEELSVLNELVDEYGHELNDETLSTFEKDYEKKVAWVNELAPNKDKTYRHPSELLNEYKLDNPFGETEIHMLQDVRTMEMYYRMSQDIDQFYREIHLARNAEAMISLYGMKGTAADTVRMQFQKLDGRLHKLITNGEHKHLFFNGMTYEMHALLFKEIGRALLFELLILVVLITATITNYEFENRTGAISYSTKTGRKLIIHKLYAAAIFTFTVSIVLIGLTLSTYFLIYDYSGLWDVPISTYFNTEMPLPYITWWKLSFIEYMGLFVLLILISQYLFMGMAFIMSIFMKNTYLVFFAFLILVGGGIWLPGIVPLKTNLVFYLYYNPFMLMMNPHEWFMGNGAFTIYKNYEAVTAGVWIVLLSILSAYSIRHFKHQQLQ